MENMRPTEPVHIAMPNNEVHEVNGAQPGHWSQDRLAKHLNVSTRTLTRWHQRGLKPIYALTPSGKKTVRYDHREALRFISDHPRLARRAQAFSHMTAVERQNMVALASEFAQQADLGIHEISRRIAEQTGRAVETVRSTLRRFEKKHPNQAIFSNSRSGRAGRADQRIAKLYDAGFEPAEIARKLGKPHDVMHKRIIAIRVGRIRKPCGDHVYCKEFEVPANKAGILSYEKLTKTSKTFESTFNPSRESRISGTPALLPSRLSREDEQGLFQCYNFLKFSASEMVKDPASVERDIKRLEEAESLTGRAMNMRDHLVQMNLGLLCGLARKYARGEEQYTELVSEGGMALMRAIELFDYSRGFKFSTYASSAMINRFWQVMRNNRKHYARCLTGQEELLRSVEDAFEPVQETEYLDAIRQHLEKALGMLTDREVTVVKRRFGLMGGGTGETLEQIGCHLGVCKERVRQIQISAMCKLKAALEPSEMELLVG